jgi:translation elongation factor EF-G
VRVEHRVTDEFSMRLVFIVSAVLRNGERVRFEVTAPAAEGAGLRDRLRSATSGRAEIS